LTYLFLTIVVHFTRALRRPPSFLLWQTGLAGAGVSFPRRRESRLLVDSIRTHSSTAGLHRHSGAAASCGVVNKRGKRL